MNKYEMIFVLQADESESEMETRVEKVQKVVAEHDGEMTERNHWGVRHLAYEIRHETRGNYMHLLFKSHGDAVAVLDNEFRLDHKVLRHLIVVDEEWKERNEANRARRRPAAAAAPAPIAPPPAPAAPAAAPVAAAPEVTTTVETPVEDTKPTDPEAS